MVFWVIPMKKQGNFQACSHIKTIIFNRVIAITDGVIQNQYLINHSLIVYF